MPASVASHDTPGLAVAIRLAMSRLRSRLREEAGMASTGLTASQLVVLFRIVDRGSATAADLAKAEHVSHH